MYMKRFFAFVISAFLIFFPVYSYATTSIGGWTALDTITAGATNTINATKTAGGKVLTSAVTIAPQAGKVGKFLLKGGGSAALLLAVPQLLGDGVEWVLDPANNAVKYKPLASDPVAGAPAGYKYECSTGGIVASSPQAWNQAHCSLNNQAALGVTVRANNGSTVGFRSQCASTYTNFSCNVVLDPTGGGVDADGYKSIPIDTVAAKVISNAEAGHGPSQEAVKAAALEGFAAGEHDAALDAAAVESDAGTDNPTDPNNPADPADPVPFDPSSIIAAINSLKALLAGILSSITGMADSVTSLFDWTQEEPPEEEAPVPVPYGELGDVGLDGVDRYEERINFAGQCPANDFSVSILGREYSQPIPYEHLCRFLIALAPWLLAMTYLGTAYFVVENT